MFRKLLQQRFLVPVLLVVGIGRFCPHYDANAQFPEHAEAIHLARSLAFHHQYANAFRLAQTGPSAYCSPAFPALLASIVLVFGTGAKGHFAFQFAAALATATELALLPLLTETMGLGVCSGLLACVIGWVPPLLTFPDWEASYAALLCVVATILFWRVVSRSEERRLSAALLGTVTGLLLLTSASSSLVVAAWCLYCLSKFGRRVLGEGRWAALLIVVVMLTPWTVRNYVVFHRFIPLRSALGFNLAISNNDCAPVSMLQSEESGCVMRNSPNYNLEEAQRVQTLGEAQYDKVKLHEAYIWIRANPRRFLSLTLQRVYVFWVPSETASPWREITVQGQRKERLVIYVMTILSLPGWLLMARANRDASIVLGLWLLLFPPIYYIALYEGRYRYPILWVTFVCAGYFLSRIAGVLFPSPDAPKGTRPA